MSDPALKQSAQESHEDGKVSYVPTSDVNVGLRMNIEPVTRNPLEETTQNDMACNINNVEVPRSDTHSLLEDKSHQVIEEQDPECHGITQPLPEQTMEACDSNNDQTESIPNLNGNGVNISFKQQNSSQLESTYDIAFTENDEIDDNLCVCRVCHMPGDADQPLFHPCRCSGSIKFVHQECLKQWLKVSRKPSRCELCGVKYSFRKVYKRTFQDFYQLIDMNKIKQLAKDLLDVLYRIGKFSLKLLRYIILLSVIAVVVEASFVSSNYIENLMLILKQFGSFYQTLSLLALGFSVETFVLFLFEVVPNIIAVIKKECLRLQLLSHLRFCLLNARYIVRDAVEISNWIKFIEQKLKERSNPSEPSAPNPLSNNNDIQLAFSISDFELPDTIDFGYGNVDVKKTISMYAIYVAHTETISNLHKAKFGRSPQITVEPFPKPSLIPKYLIVPTLDDLLAIRELKGATQESQYVTESESTILTANERNAGILDTSSVSTGVTEILNDVKNKSNMESTSDDIAHLPLDKKFISDSMNETHIELDLDEHSPVNISLSQQNSLRGNTECHKCDDLYSSENTLNQYDITSNDVRYDCQAINSPVEEQYHHSTPVNNENLSSKKEHNSDIDTDNLSADFELPMKTEEARSSDQVLYERNNPEDREHSNEQAIQNPDQLHDPLNIIENIPVPVNDPILQNENEFRLPAPLDVHGLIHDDGALQGQILPQRRNENFLSRYTLIVVSSFICVLCIILIPRFIGSLLLDSLKLSNTVYGYAYYFVLQLLRDPSSYLAHVIIMFGPPGTENEPIQFKSDYGESVSFPSLSEALSLVSYSGDGYFNTLNTTAFDHQTNPRSIPVQMLFSTNQRIAVNCFIDRVVGCMQVIAGWSALLTILDLIITAYILRYFEYFTNIVMVIVDEYTPLRQIAKLVNKMVISIALFGVIIPFGFGYILWEGVMSILNKSNLNEIARNDEIIAPIKFFLSWFFGMQLVALLTDVLLVIHKTLNVEIAKIYPQIIYSIFLLGPVKTLKLTHVYELCAEAACLGALGLLFLLFCVFIPMKVTLVLFPGTMHEHKSHDNNNSAFETMIMHVVYPMLFENITQDSMYRTPIKNTIFFLAKLMKVSDILKMDQNPRDDAIPALAVHQPLGNNNVQVIEEASIQSNQDQRYKQFEVPYVIRIGLFLVSLCLCMFCVSFLFVNAPGIVGKFVCDALWIPEASRWFYFLFGFVVLWFSSYLVLYAYQDYARLPYGDFHSVVKLGTKWIRILFKIAVIAGTTLSIPPFLLYFLMDYMFPIPFLGPANATPRIAFFKAWVYGLTVMRLYGKLVVMGAGVDEPTRAMIDRIMLAFQFNLDIDNALNLSMLFTKIIKPLYLTLLDFTVTPFIIARIYGVYQTSYASRTRTMRFSFILYLLFRVALAVLAWIGSKAKDFFNQIRDSMYSVETELTNR